ncbi:MAG: sodium:proton antiporter [Thiobacillus sp.]|nr:sodium:proton antiporter [Thiobacillus sp.]
MRKYYLPLGLVLTTLAATPAFAHPGIAGHADFMGGFAHPFSGWDHMLAMAALGLWLGNTKSTGIVAAFVAFAGALLSGFVLGVNGYHMPLVEAGILASVFVFGLLAVTARRLPAALAAPLIAIFALCHGHAHGAEATGSAWLYGLGFISASLLIAGAAYGVMRVLSREKRSLA